MTGHPNAPGSQYGNFWSMVEYPPIFIVSLSIAHAVIFGTVQRVTCCPWPVARCIHTHPTCAAAPPVPPQEKMAMVLPEQDTAANWWRCISLLLMHNSLAHLLNNLVLQLSMAFTLEMIDGPHRVAAIFLAGGLLGVLVETLIGEAATNTPNPYQRAPAQCRSLSLVARCPSPLPARLSGRQTPSLSGRAAPLALLGSGTRWGDLLRRLPWGLFARRGAGVQPEP